MKSIFTSPNISKILEYLILALIIFLPFHTIISVFFTFKIVVPGINFFKE